MDPTSKKHKVDENSAAFFESTTKLTPEDARKIIEPFTTEQLLEILQDAAICHPDDLNAVRNIAACDHVQHKLFIRSLRTFFSSYGDLDEAIVILDKATEKSKGYNFVTFKREI